MIKTRFALKFWSGKRHLPSENQMINDMHEQTELHWKRGNPKRQSHFLGITQSEYFDQLSQVADIENMPKVIEDIYFDASIGFYTQQQIFREYQYILLNDEQFSKKRYYGY